jgi:nucleoside-diphosphate-sugar epimerase
MAIDKVFLAGAAGVIGRRLVPLLIQRGYHVFGTTRSPERAADLERAGVTPVVLDVYDRQSVARAVAAARPRLMIHQLTDLSGGFEPDRIAETLERNSRLRVEGTRNLVAAAQAAGVQRLVAQSLAWVYAPGHEPHVEADPLDPAQVGVVSLEEAVFNAPPIEGVVLRYGWFYGPGANPSPAGSPGVHVDAAAQAAVLALERGAPGAYNVAELGPKIATDKARRELAWDPGFRLTEGAAAGRS